MISWYVILVFQPLAGVKWNSVGWYYIWHRCKTYTSWKLVYVQLEAPRASPRVNYWHCSQTVFTEGNCRVLNMTDWNVQEATSIEGRGNSAQDNSTKLILLSTQTSRQQTFLSVEVKAGLFLSRPPTFSNILLKIAQHFSVLLLMPAI